MKLFLLEKKNARHEKNKILGIVIPLMKSLYHLSTRVGSSRYDIGFTPTFKLIFSSTFNFLCSAQASLGIDRYLSSYSSRIHFESFSAIRWQYTLLNFAIEDHKSCEHVKHAFYKVLSSLKMELK